MCLPILSRLLDKQLDVYGKACSHFCETHRVIYTKAVEKLIHFGAKRAQEEWRTAPKTESYTVQWIM